MVVGKITKKLRRSIFDEQMERGYELFNDGYLDDLQWNKWSWTCYKFTDEEIDHDELMERLDCLTC